jgi:plastocyanin
MPLVRLTAALLAAAALSGCGGAEPVTAERGRPVAITLDDFFIAPQELRAQPGRITVAVTNRGRIPHNLRIRGTDGKERIAVTTLLPGRSATASADLARGDYKMVCTVANHEELGMTGRLVVR